MWAARSQRAAETGRADRTYAQNSKVPLPSEGAEHDGPDLTVLGGTLARDAEALARLAHGCPAKAAHLIVLVQLAREALRVRVVPERGDERVCDHDRLEVEASVTDVPVRVGGVSRRFSAQ